MRSIVVAILLAGAGIAPAGGDETADWIPRMGTADERGPVPEDAEAEVAFAWIPWAATIEEALARAKVEKRLVLAFVTPWDDKRFEAGHAGAAEIARFLRPGAAPPAPASIESDPGYVKERALLTALLGHPDLSALVERCFVPVRLRMHTWHFLSSGTGTWQDPLPALGVRAGELRPPALVFCDPRGKLV
ncbi:MAG TPA: hypothetical protein VMS76_04630, partial [Planctomycetota bacterium]|nr:hypothetical protein [Planctomycetota bacterium]